VTVNECGSKGQRIDRGIVIMMAMKWKIGMRGNLVHGVGDTKQIRSQLGGKGKGIFASFIVILGEGSIYSHEREDCLIAQKVSVEGDSRWPPWNKISKLDQTTNITILSIHNFDAQKCVKGLISREKKITFQICRI